jgi:hypothetical protein
LLEDCRDHAHYAGRSAALAVGTDAASAAHRNDLVLTALRLTERSHRAAVAQRRASPPEPASIATSWSVGQLDSADVVTRLRLADNCRDRIGRIALQRVAQLLLYGGLIGVLAAALPSGSREQDTSSPGPRRL